MSDEAHVLFNKKVDQSITAWQAAEQGAQKRMYALPSVLEAANPTILVLNLGKVPITTTSAFLSTANAEEIKEHRGVRVTFLVLKTLSPGWTWVAAAGTEKESGAKTKKAGAVPVATGPVVKDKLNTMTGENVIMHSYDLTNVRGTFVKANRSTDCVALGQGMVLSMMIWPKGFAKVFKEQKGEDMFPFDICTIQLGIKSLQAPALDGGNMLEVKAYAKVWGETLSLGSSRLFNNIVGASLQECAVIRSRFADASFCSEVEGINQAMIKGNISTTVSVVKVKLSKGDGTFAIGADDIMRFHVTQALADLPCTNIVVKHDNEAYGASKDWVCKLFNILTLLGSMELVVIIDTYQKNKTESNSNEMISEAFARPDISTMIGQMIEKRFKPISDFESIGKVFSPAGSTTMAIFELAPEVLVALDNRILTKKTAVTGKETGSTLVHPNAPFWERGYAIHFFLEGRLVHCAVIPLPMDGSIDGNKFVLTAITPPTWEDAEFEDTPPATMQDTEMVPPHKTEEGNPATNEGEETVPTAPKRKRGSA